MKCTGCGKQNDRSYSYCYWCGIPLPDDVYPIDHLPAENQPQANKNRLWIIGVSLVVAALILLRIYSFFQNIDDLNQAYQEFRQLINDQAGKFPKLNSNNESALSQEEKIQAIALTQEAYLGKDNVRLRELDYMILINIPKGEYRMGNSDGNDDEKPEHIVSLDAFWIDQTEVTNGQYARCVNASFCTEPKMIDSVSREKYYLDPDYLNYPVVHVDWDQASTYCSWVSGRLPTEAEWEKAARGTDERLYPWGSSFNVAFANICDRNCPLTQKENGINDDFGDTAPTGTFPQGASFYGVLDMSGNVSEWTQDWYQEDYYQKSPTLNPHGPKTGPKKVVRGGYWGSLVDSSQTVSRDDQFPFEENTFTGFRCVTDR